MRTRPIRSSGDPVPSSLDNDRGKQHRSVLLHEAIEQLAIQKDDVVVDATLGGAGHARAMAHLLSERGVFVGFDLDADALVRAREALAGAKPKIHLIEENFRDLSSQLDQIGIPHIDKALYDLGWSGYQLAAGRGFSFLSDEPLLMTYSREGALTAAEIVNNWEEGSIADIIFGWGEERYARRIAKAIVERRARKPFKMSRDLGETIKAAVPSSYRYGRLHPATKTFQALRIAVNDELGALKVSLEAAWDRLAPGGRIAVITFHSIEDRIVKTLFVDWGRSDGTRITRSPIRPGEAELKENPRARSAKLRVIEKNESSNDQNI